MKKMIGGVVVVVILVTIGIAVAAQHKKTEKAPDPAPGVASVESVPTVTTSTVPPKDEKPVTILTYHSIEPKPATKEGAMQLHYRVTPENFEAQIKYLMDQGYTPITFTALIDHVSNGAAIPEKSIVITFDDGWKSQLDYAVPVLKKYGFTATFFIITDLRNHRYMSWDEVRSLARDGFEVASHTKTHPHLTSAKDDALVQEIAGSKKILDEQLGFSITTLAYPYYQHDARVMKAVQDAGYKGARGGWGNFKNNKDHLFEFTSQEVVNNPNPFASKRLPG